MLSLTFRIPVPQTQCPAIFCRWTIAEGVLDAGSKQGGSAMGKGNNSQRNDKKNKKPKQDKAKPAGKQ